MEVEMMSPANGIGQSPLADNNQREDEALRDVLLSSALVSKAFVGLEFNSIYKSDLKSLKLYYIYQHWSLFRLLYFCIISIHLLTIFEPVGLTRSHANFIGLTTTVELLCLIYFIIFLVLRYSVTQKYIFWNDSRNILLIFTILLTVLDLIVYFARPSMAAIRYTLCLRPLFLIAFTDISQIRQALRNIRNTLPEITNVLILFFMSLAMFSLIAFKLFANKQSYNKNSSLYSSTEYFTDYVGTLFDLYALVTTANNPTIAMNAYNENRFYGIFFVVFLLINLYLFMNIILAVVYNKFRANLKNDVRRILQIRADSLGKAYDIMTKGDESGMSFEQFQMILQTVIHNTTYFDYTQADPEIVNILWLFLESNGKIKRSDFIDLGQIMTLEIKIIYYNSEYNYSGWLSPLYNSKLSQKFCNAVKHIYFRYFFDIMILANVIVIGLQDGSQLTTLDSIFLLIFICEIFAKLYTYGVLKLMKSFWNVFDALVIFSAIVIWILINYMPSYSITTMKMAEHETYNILMVLRVLRICKLLGNVERFKVPIITIKSLLPSICTFGGLMMATFYFYAIIGIHLFHGYVISDPNRCDPSLPDCCPEYLRKLGIHYCTINFNSISSAFLLLFNLMVVNEWPKFCRNYVVMTKTRWTRLYFVAIHLHCVILILNIFTAFVIEAFFLELTISTNGSVYANSLLTRIRQLGINTVDGSDINPDDAFHPDDENADYIPYPKINTSNRASSQERPKYRIIVKDKKSVEALLIRMFQREIELESQGKC